MEIKAVTQVLIASLVLESVWETLKMAIDAWKDKTILITRIGTIVVGLYLAFAYGLDILAVIGLHDHIPYSGYILTGILISRGSNFTHDLLIRLGTFREQIAVLTPMSTNSVPAGNVGSPIQVTKVDSELKTD